MGLLQLLVDLRRLYLRQKLARRHPIADVHVSLSEIAARPRIDNRVLNGLGRGGQCQVRLGSRLRTDHINPRHIVLRLLGGGGQFLMITYPGNHTYCQQDKEQTDDPNCNIHDCSCLASWRRTIRSTRVFGPFWLGCLRWLVGLVAHVASSLSKSLGGLCRSRL